jgi:peptidyl-prolyl cis-trans isomerase B (cyclophilin B)
VFCKKNTIFLKKIMSRVKISTEKGDMIAELYDNETPLTVKNFLELISKGFYNGLNFHRVIPGFVAQGGCPNGVGNGGPGYTIPCEVTAPKQFHELGVLSMAHAGRNTGGSQFFICHGRQSTQHLDGNHTCFGKVIEGLDVIPNITQGTKINLIEIL